MNDHNNDAVAAAAAAIDTTVAVIGQDSFVADTHLSLHTYTYTCTGNYLQELVGKLRGTDKSTMLIRAGQFLDEYELVVSGKILDSVISEAQDVLSKNDCLDKDYLSFVFTHAHIHIHTYTYTHSHT